MAEIKTGGGIGFLLVGVPIAVLLLPLLCGALSPLFVGEVDSTGVFLEKPDKKHKSCVREKAYMRYRHWELLRGIREDVVRYGKRGEIELDGCRDCHKSRERFCNRCHNAVSLFPDCFDCHYYP